MNTLDYSAFRGLTVRAEAGIHFVTLNRPDRLNAIDAGMATELLDYFAALQSDHAVRIVVLKGAGRHFCASTVSLVATSPASPHAPRFFVG